MRQYHLKVDHMTALIIGEMIEDLKTLFAVQCTGYDEAELLLVV